MDLGFPTQKQQVGSLAVGSKPVQSTFIDTTKCVHELYEDLILDTPTLQIPHPRMSDRSFVLVPLAEIAPNWIEPISGCTIQYLLHNVECDDVHLLKMVKNKGEWNISTRKKVEILIS